MRWINRDIFHDSLISYDCISLIERGFSGLHKFHLDNILSRESRVLLIEEFAEYLWLCIVSDASNASIRIDNKKSCWHSCKSNWNKYDFSVLVDKTGQSSESHKRDESDKLIFPTWTVGIFFFIELFVLWVKLLTIKDK